MTHRAESIASYQVMAGQAMVTLFGVSYDELVEMAPTMDGDGMRALNTGAARGMTPERFAQTFGTLHNLARVDLNGREWAENHNRSRAAIIAFASDARGWRLGNDGCAYRQVEGGRVLRLDCVDMIVGGRAGVFTVDLSRDPVALSQDPDPTDYFRRIRAPNTNVAFVALTAQLDIGDTIAAALHRMRAAIQEIEEAHIVVDDQAEQVPSPRFA